MPNLSVQPPMSRRSALLPWAVLVVAVGLSVAAWWLTGREVRRTTQAQFERLTERVQGTLRRRFDTAALLLHGAAAFPAASERVTAPDWSVYLRDVSRQLGDGVVGLGYVEKVALGGIDELEARMRADGLANFTVQRQGAGDWLSVVLDIEPRERNTDVLGLNIASGVTRKEAAERAARTNSLVLSRRIRINYDKADVPGFLLFLPVYQKGADLTSPESRLSIVQGWVYASIRIDQLMTGVAESVGQQIDLDVYEGDSVQPEKRLFDSHGLPGGPADLQLLAEEKSAGALRAVQPFDIYGRRWTLALHTRPEFARANFSSLPLWVLGVGLVFSVLVTVLTRVLVTARGQALKLAGDMTIDLRRLALVASHTASAVVLTDAEWRVEWINRGFTRMFGFNLDEIKGRKPVTFMAGPDSDVKILEAIDEAAKQKRPFHGEVLNYTKDGRRVWIELEVQPIINEAGELEGFMSLQLDITDRKLQAERMREAMEAAEKANQAKSQFLAMMSHEIRTPMNGVIGMTSLLIDTDLNPEQRESAEIIRQSGESLLRIINDVLDFSKIESGRLDLEQTEFSVVDCVEGAVDLLAAPAAKKQVELIYEVEDDLPTLVVGDASRLRQVLVNLVGNAVKFTEKGEVSVTVKASGRQPSAVELRFEVRDTGIGISPEGMERLFKAFSQVDASMTRKFGGTGLGLVISRRLVELMGGRITAESELGQGSVFRFTLRLPMVDDGAAIPARATGSLANRTVLIVVANPTARRLLMERTRKWGMVPVEAATAESALVHLGSDSRFDAALIDAQLPDLDGRSLAGKVRELVARSTLPLILLTTPGQRDNPRDTFASVLIKPVKPTQLFDSFVTSFWPSRGSTAPMSIKPPVAAAPTAEVVHVLFAGSKPDQAGTVVEKFSRLNCLTDVAGNTAEVIEAVRRRAYGVVFLDLQDSVAAGLDQAIKIRRALPVSDLTWLVAMVGELTAADRESLRSAGINDCLPVPYTETQLAAALERAKWRLPG